MLILRIPRAESVKPRQIRITPTVEGSAADGSTAPADGATADETPTGA